MKSLLSRFLTGMMLCCLLCAGCAAESQEDLGSQEEAITLVVNCITDSGGNATGYAFDPDNCAVRPCANYCSGRYTSRTGLCSPITYARSTAPSSTVIPRRGPVTLTGHRNRLLSLRSLKWPLGAWEQVG
jgi:hypothetical protein